MSKWSSTEIHLKMPIAFSEKWCLPHNFKMLQKAHQLLWKIVYFHLKGLDSKNKQSPKWIISEAPNCSNAIWEPVSSCKDEDGPWPVWFLGWGMCMGAEEALSKDSRHLSCFRQPLQLSMHVQWDAGGMAGQGSQNSSKRKESYSCAYEMKLLLRREEKCSEKWGQVVNPQKLIGTTANFIH